MSGPSLQQFSDGLGPHLVPDGDRDRDDFEFDSPASPDYIYTENFDSMEEEEITLLAEVDTEHPVEIPVTRRLNSSVRFGSFGNLDVVHRLGNMGIYNFTFERPASFQRMPQPLRKQHPEWHLVDWKGITFVMDNIFTFAQDGGGKCFHQLVEPESPPRKKTTKIIKFPFTYMYLSYKPINDIDIINHAALSWFAGLDLPPVQVYKPP